MGFVADLSHRARQSRPVRYGMMGTLAFGSGDYVPYDADTLKQSMRLIGSGSWGLNAIKKFGETYSNSIDPRIDTMLPEQVLAAGDAHTGSTASPFIRNEKIITPKDWGNLNKLVEQKLLTESELTSFVNLLGTAHKRQAQAALDYTRDPSAANRMAAAQANLDTAEIPFSVIMQIFSRNPDLRKRAEHGLDMEHLRAAFPKSTQVARAVQIIDDQTDVALDALNERNSGRLGTNFVLAKAQEAGGLTALDGNIEPRILTRLDKLASRNGAIRISELPQSLRAGMHSTGREFHAIAQEMNAPVRALLNASWEHSIKRGILPAKNDRMTPVESSHSR